MSEVDNFSDRLSYQGDPTELLNGLLGQFDLGKVQEFKVVTDGFEDCNFIVEAQEKQLFVKCYAKIRTPKDIDRNADILDAVSDSDIHHPHLYRTLTNKLIATYDGVKAVAMDYIDGQSFHTLNRAPSESEAALVLAEAVKINNLQIKPPYIYDSIAVVNIKNMYERVRPYMSKGDLALVKPVIKSFAAIGIDTLPKTFVHGDLISTNVILDKQGKIWVVDFSVANTYPRIQELAVIASSLMYSRGMPLRELTQKINAVYEAQGGIITAAERKAVFPLARAAQAMELMGGYQYIHINKDNVEEASHWQKVGREGLKASADNN